MTKYAKNEKMKATAKKTTEKKGLFSEHTIEMLERAVPITMVLK